MAGCGADTDANSLIVSLTQDASFNIPEIDLSGDEFKFPDGAMGDEISKLTIADLTTGDIEGAGAFDSLMRGFKAHLMEEWNSGRITGDDYTKAYIALTESAMSQGIAFLLGKDNAFWQAQLAQVQAFTARVTLETTKVALAATQFEAMNQKANYALTKLRMSSESAAYCTAQFNLNSMLPVQAQILTSQKTGQDTENSISAYNLNQMLPAQKTMLDSQKSMVDSQKTGQDTANSTAQYNLSQILPAQLQVTQQQRAMLVEQTEAQRAQTSDTRTDGAAVVGVLGKQKELYAQQITSYQRDSELKVAKVFADAWTVQKTIDEGLTAPTSFTNDVINNVMVDVRTKAGIAG